MPKFALYKGHDAYVNYATVVVAATLPDAQQIAHSPDYAGIWVAQGINEYDDVTYHTDVDFELEGDDDLAEVAMYEMMPEERDTVLAALRMWQAAPEDARVPYAEIAFNERETALSDEEIDDLCESLNQ